MMSSENSSGRFLSFTLDGREFAIGLENVREVVGFPEFTPLPQDVPHMLGLMTLRDEIITLVDLRIRIGLEPSLSHDTAVIICRINETFAGVVVDSINSVVSPEPSSVLDTPPVANSQNHPTLVPQAIRSNQELILVLDIVKVLSSDERLFLDLKKTKLAA
ncbi:MAG: chemotaxis protein CheW [Bdellovibrionota bacterium]